MTMTLLPTPTSAPSVPYKKRLCNHYTRGNCLTGLDCTFAHGVRELRSFENPVFKSQLCTAYEQGGICEMGSDCLLAHGEGELRTDDPPIAGSALQTNGNGSAAALGTNAANDGSPERKKGAFKSALCIHFMKNANCRMGAACVFAHGKEDLVNVATPDVNDPKFKTKLCLRFEQDAFCPNGEYCVFAHGEAELKDASDLVSANRKATLYKTSLCNNFATLGVCPSGKNCSFAHGRYEIRPAGFDGDFDAKIAENPKWKCTLCNIFQQQGRCNRTNCDYAHGPEELRQEHVEAPKQSKGNFKTALCNNFKARGFCLHEDKCTFAHGEEELHVGKDAFNMMTKMLRKRTKEEMTPTPKQNSVPATNPMMSHSHNSAGNGDNDQKLFAEFLEFKKFKQQTETAPAPVTSFYNPKPMSAPRNSQSQSMYPPPAPTPQGNEMDTQGYYHSGGYQSKPSSVYPPPPPSSMAAFNQAFNRQRLGDNQMPHSDYVY